MLTWSESYAFLLGKHVKPLRSMPKTNYGYAVTRSTHDGNLMASCSEMERT